MARNLTVTVEPTRDRAGYYRRRVITSGKSPRINGVLQLKPQTLNDTSDLISSTRLYRYGTDYRDPYYFSGGLDISQWQTVHFANISPPDWLDPLYMRREAEAKLRSKIAGVVVNVPDLFRTRVETGNMVLQTLGRIRKSYSALRKGKLKKAASHLGVTLDKRKFSGSTPPELWLELQYGWKPLLGDMYTLLDKPFNEVTGSISAIATSSRSIDSGRFVAQSHTIIRSGMVKYRYHANVKVTVKNSAVQAASQWGLTNPLLVAWEAVPFSFVVDWFYPVGDYLEDLGRFHGIHVSDYSCTSKTEVDSFCTATYYTKNGVKYFGEKMVCSSRRQYRLKKRYVGAFPLTQIPSFQNPITSSGRIANALSLLAVTFGQSPKRKI